MWQHEEVQTLLRQELTHFRPGEKSLFLHPFVPETLLSTPFLQSTQ
jgi:hypothetical protein